MKTPPFKLACASALLLFACAALAQGVGVASIGATGGLHIPSAYVLGTGEAALSLDNEDPALGTLYNHHRNYTLGFGLGGSAEIFGRLNHVQNIGITPAWQEKLIGGDISLTAKWQLPIDVKGLPKLALGLTDYGGGATYFRSVYAVGSDEIGPLRWSLGYARSTPSSLNKSPVLDGLFGGAELRLGASGATVLAESDGKRQHAGLRYYGPVMPWLGDSQFIGTVQRSFGGAVSLDHQPDQASVNFSLVLPLGADDAARERRTRRVIKDMTALKPLQLPSPMTPASREATAERLGELLRTLRASGLDRLRVGTIGSDLVVEYENQRYLHNEVDALGIVLGLAAEHAPRASKRVHVISLKAGLVMFETSVNISSYRAWLRDPSESAAVGDSLGFGRLSGYDAGMVDWLGGTGQAVRRLNVALSPLLNYTLGTEVGLFSYSLALQARLSAPLWRGSEVYGDVVQRVDNSINMDPGHVYEASRHRNGLKTFALQQSYWIDPRVFASVGAGRYQYNQMGVEGEAIVFVPWGQDSVHLRGRATRSNDSPETTDAGSSASASYRWHMTPSTWVEGGVQHYSDGSKGPSLVVTRWFGDAAVQMFARQGGSNTFVGLELNLPLTPRQGMGSAPVQLTGNPRYALSMRTLLTSATNTGNFQIPNAVRPVDLSYKPEVELLNSGRVNPDYIRSQLARLRESFYLYALALMQ
jgi:hypothetical protein